MIIYPPIIANVIPAFTKNKIIIPITWNEAVRKEEVEGFNLIIKNYNSSKDIATIISKKEDNIDLSNIVFNITDLELLKEKQYYKFQIAYMDDLENNTNLAYSSASIGRCIGITPTILVNGLEKDVINLNLKSYTGIYKTSINNEPVYQYQFIVKNESNIIIQDTGLQYHNISNDNLDNEDEYQSIDTFQLLYELEQNKMYTIVYKIITVNGFEDEISYIIVNEEKLPIMFVGEVVASQRAFEKDNGIVSINLKGTPCKGNFYLERTEDNQKWDKITTIHMNSNSNLTDFTWQDFSIEQGKTYTYAISQYGINNTGVEFISQRIKSKPITVDFEDMFLSDGERQLKIKFNPKVSSFKTTLLESKQDTLGSAYPYFFRNGQVGYKEIPISGLLSYWQDEANLFIKEEELGLANTFENRKETAAALNQTLKSRTTQLVDYNYTAERIFKLKVMDWLNDGKPKLLRTPTEGNYIVRLMNISLSPDDKLSRMLHTFSATGYEYDKMTYENLQKYNLVNQKELSSTIITTQEINSISLRDQQLNTAASQIKLENISNIIWETERPNLITNIEIDDKKYYNTTGVFKTLPNKNISKLIINLEQKDIEYSNITYTRNIEQVDETQDDFTYLISNSSNKLISVPAGINIPDNLKIYQTYVLRAYLDTLPTSVNDEIHTITFIDSESVNEPITIDMSDGQIRFYENLGPNISYTKTGQVHMDIYGRIEIKEEEDNVESFT